MNHRFSRDGTGPRLAVVLSPVLFALLGCSSSSSSSVPSTSERLAFSYLLNLVPVSVTAGGATAEGFVDTGDPFVELDPQAFPAASSLPANGGDVASMTIGSQPATNVYVLPSAGGLTSPDPAFPIGANVGCAGICAFVAAFDYRAVAFTLGPVAPTPPTGLEPETAFPFTLMGGSQVDGVTVPKSRIVVTVSIEGASYAMMLDTGATSVTVSQAAYSALTADGRAQITGGMVETTSGSSTASAARCKSVVVGGVEVDSVVVAHDTSFDQNLAAVSTDVGMTIDGSLGGDFLHDFYLTIDYPKQMVHLARYANLDFAVDEAEQIGIGLEAQGENWVVAGTSSLAASKGIATGDVVSSIDGVDLAGLSVSQATLLLFGPVGQTKTVTFGAAANVTDQTLPLVVEEFLPLP